MPAVRIATKEDVEFLAPRLRKADLEELAVGSGTSAYDALMEGLVVSHPAYTGVDDDGTPILMFGAAETHPKAACVWMLSSDALLDHVFPFLRRSRKMLDEFNDKWPVLYNVCDERNTAHVQWMQKLGYTFINRHPEYGVGKMPFLEFVRTKKHV
ncbi:hypothetical protein [Labrys neptuniae]